MTREWTIDATELAGSLVSSFSAGPILNDEGHRLLAEETVAHLNGLKIQIFSREHPPPHFRVSYAGDSADFDISNCAKLAGGLSKWERTILDWHTQNKPKLIETWNRTRPSDCPVGPYQEPDA